MNCLTHVGWSHTATLGDLEKKKSEKKIEKFADRLKMTVREKPKKLYYDETCIKLFIGQIPRAWTEKEIMNVFSRFGEIFDLQILNDRITGLSRGCAFLTYQLNDSAYACIEKFHGLEEGV